jgi:hypothetical protein
MFKVDANGPEAKEQLRNIGVSLWAPKTLQRSKEDADGSGRGALKSFQTGLVSLVAGGRFS